MSKKLIIILIIIVLILVGFFFLKYRTKFYLSQPQLAPSLTPLSSQTKTVNDDNLDQALTDLDFISKQ